MEQTINETIGGRTASTLTDAASGSASYQAYQILRVGFTVAPVVAGRTKTFNDEEEICRESKAAQLCILPNFSFLRQNFL